MPPNFFKLKLLLLLMLPGHTYISAQTNKTTVLKTGASLVNAGEQNLANLLLLCKKFENLNPDSLYCYALKAKRTAAILNKKPGMLLAQYYNGVQYALKGKTDSSLAIADKGLQNLHYKTDGNIYVKYLLLKARSLNNLDRPKESLAILYPLLYEAEKKEDTLTQGAAINKMVGAYVALGQDEEAMSWCYKVLHILPSASSDLYWVEVNIALSNLSLCYLHLFENKHQQVFVDSAEKYNAIAIALNKKYDFLPGLAYNLSLRGGICSYTKKVAEGENALQQSLAIYKQIGNTFYTINTMSVMGNFYAVTQQPLKGIAICREGIAFSKDLEPNFYLYENLANNYKLAGKYQQYGETMATLLKVKDSMYIKNSAQSLSKLQADYELEKKENLIAQQKFAITKKNNLFYGSLMLLALTFAGGWTIFFIRKKNQAIKLSALQLEVKSKMMKAVLEAEENERRRIAADLHDSVAQKMVVAKLNLETLEYYLPVMNAEQQQVYDNILLLINESCTDVRELSHSMMPQAFFAAGLNAAVKSFVEKIDHRILQINFNAEGEPDEVESNTQVITYRILQESVQNVLKHAKATRLEITVIYTGGSMDIIVEDNGVGFETIGAPEGVGMKNIRSRIEILNGTIEVQSSPGAGTVLTFFIPEKQV